MSAIALGTVLAGVLDFGSNAYWVREYASGRMGRRSLGARLITKIAFSIAVAGAGAAALAMVAPPGWWRAGPVAVSLLVNQSMQAVLRANMLSHRVAVSMICDRATVALLVGLASLSGADPAAMLWLALTAGSLVSAAMSWRLIPRQTRPVLGFRGPRNPWRGCGPYGLYGVAIAAQNLDVPLTGQFGGAAAAGLYGAVNRLVQPMSLLTTAFSAAAMPFVAEAPSVRAAWLRIKSALWLPAAAIAACGAVAMLAPYLVVLLIGSQYQGSVGVLQILALGTIPAVLNQPIAVFLQARGHDRVVAAVVTFGVLIQLALTIVLSQRFGAVGSAWAYVVLQVGVLGCLLLVAARRAGRRPGGRRSDGGSADAHLEPAGGRHRVPDNAHN